MKPVVETLADLVAEIDALEGESREHDDLATRRLLLGRRRRLERKAGRHLLLAGEPPPKLRLSQYRIDRYRKFAKMSDEEFEQRLEYSLARLRVSAAHGNVSPAIRMICTPFRRDEHGCLSRIIRAEAESAEVQVQE